MWKRNFVTFIGILGAGHALLAQQTTLDWKLHDVGKVRQVVTNTGGLNAKFDDFFDYRRLINCEFPPGSGEEHVTEAGLWVAAVVGSDSLVSVAQGEGSPREFFPTDAPWDTIWTVSRGDTIQIPYRPNYVGVSDQDFICRYNDYGPASVRVGAHTPLYLDIVQTSYAWGSPPLDEFIVLNYYIAATRIDLHDVYLVSWINGNIGYGLTDAFGLDDESFFRLEKMLSVSVDLPGGEDGDAISPVAEKIYPPPEGPATRKVTYVWYNGRLEGLPSRDEVRYTHISGGTIMQDQVSTGDGTKSFVSIGPYELSAGDTLHLVVGLILGKGLKGVEANADFLDWLIVNDYRIPFAPPPPPVRVEARNRSVMLRWDPRPGDINPEIYQDPNRADSATQPFEGYRIYKSTRSAAGPWTLLAEYDLPDNEFGQNTGLAYEYTDVGLLNNIEYYYTVTAFSKPDAVIGFPSLQSSLSANVRVAVPGSPPPATVGQVAVVPNPYRGDIAYYAYNPPWERTPASRNRWMEQDRRMQFINLPIQCEIRIYTVAGVLVDTILHDDPYRGYEDWNLTSSVGQAISSGIYLFSVEDLRTGTVQVSKFVIIK